MYFLFFLHDFILKGIWTFKSTNNVSLSIQIQKIQLNSFNKYRYYKKILKTNFKIQDDYYKQGNTNCREYLFRRKFNLIYPLILFWYEPPASYSTP